MRFPTSLSLILSSMLFSACASSASTGMTQGPATQTIGSSDVGGTIRIANSSAPDVAQLPFALDRVWAALPFALDSLKVPVGTVDPKTHIIGNESFKIRQRLGRRYLSTLLECGTTQIGPNADSYDVLMTVLVRLQPAAEGKTTMYTTVHAMAKPATNNQGYSQCSSKGTLESLMTALMMARLQNG